jgi:hypothetical protein
MHPQRGFPLLIAGAIFLLAGCSNFHEQYLFRAGRPGQANYYRVKIDGFTRFSSSQFAAGLYDAEAVDALFGELSGSGKRVTVTSAFETTTSQPISSNPSNPGVTPVTAASTEVTMVSGAQSASKAGPASQTVAGKSMNNQKFVFFLSSNANAFINQIQTYVTADRMQTAVMTLIFKDDLQKLEASRSQTSAADLRAKTLGEAMKGATTPLGTGDTAKSADVRSATLDVLALLASRSSVSSPPGFASLAEAEKWLREHPRAFRPTGGVL